MRCHTQLLCGANIDMQVFVFLICGQIISKWSPAVAVIVIDGRPSSISAQRHTMRFTNGVILIHQPYCNHNRW